jgi:hypothetical protein
LTPGHASTIRALLFQTLAEAVEWCFALFVQDIEATRTDSMEGLNNDFNNLPGDEMVSKHCDRQDDGDVMG